MQGFRDQVVLLTGASEGIGRALALSLAGQGARLGLVARNASRLESLVADCTAAGGEALAIPADVADPAQCATAVRRCLAHFGTLDMLVANAGATMWSRLDELADESVLERLVRVNYLGAAWITRDALPALKASRGRVVAVSSLAGLAGVPTRTGYAASKHAMFGFFDSLRIELADSGVSVTVAAPDFVLSEIHRRAAGPDGRPLGDSPMQEGRIMTAERCAEIILEAAARRRRTAFTSARGRLLPWLRLLAPRLVDAMAARVIRERH